MYSMSTKFICILTATITYYYIFMYMFNKVDFLLFFATFFSKFYTQLSGMKLLL